MPQTNIDENNVMVITYGFVDFLQETDELRKQGYEFNFVDNETYPQMIGHYFQCIMQKTDETRSVESVQGSTLKQDVLGDKSKMDDQEDKPKRGRPSTKE